jgi:hypothetical protein
MKIDLFSTTIFEHLIDNFGIYDDAELPTEPAKVVSFDDGIAKVQNPHKCSIFFIPLDKNIECLRPDGSMESQCDALLICSRPESKYDFYLVELKKVRVNWITDGTEQLKTTINTFTNNYDLSCLSKKSAFLANKKKSFYHFQSAYKELMETFRNDTGFRLIICATVPIK